MSRRAPARSGETVKEKHGRLFCIGSKRGKRGVDGKEREGIQNKAN